MRAYYNQPREEFVWQLRDAAIRTKAAPAVINAIDELVELPEGWISDEDHQKALDEMEKESYDEGLDDGKIKGRAAALEEVEDERENIEERAFADGRADGIAVSGKASDVARVDALTAAMEKAVALLRAPLNGVKEPDAIRARPAKIGELKREMALAISALGQALHSHKSAS